MPKRRSLDDDPAIVDLRERVARLETDIVWIKDKLKKIDNRMWATLITVILSILLMIWKTLMS